MIDADLLVLRELAQIYGGQHAVAAVDRLAKAVEDRERLEKLLYSTIGDLGPECFALSEHGPELREFCETRKRGNNG